MYSLYFSDVTVMSSKLQSLSDIVTCQFPDCWSLMMSVYCGRVHMGGIACSKQIKTKLKLFLYALQGCMKVRKHNVQ